MKEGMNEGRNTFAKHGNHVETLMKSRQSVT